MTDVPEYILDRIFDAPRELVWRAWTDPELLQRWYGPGAETTIHEFDLKPGGFWLNEMKWGGKSNFQKSSFPGSDRTGKAGLGSSFIHGFRLERHRKSDDGGLAPATTDDRDIRG